MTAKDTEPTATAIEVDVVEETQGNPFEALVLPRQSSTRLTLASGE
jgi:hypothetical protein